MTARPRLSLVNLLVVVVVAMVGCDGASMDHATSDASASDASASDASTSDASTSGASTSGGADLYPRVQAILEQSCAYIRCHAGPLVGAGLNLARGMDYRAALVGVTACEYDRMARVEPYDPDRSWIMVKLTADFRSADDPQLPNYIDFEPDPDWEDGHRGCSDSADDGTPLFGQRMPLTAPNMLPEDDLEAIRAWIAAGAGS